MRTYAIIKNGVVENTIRASPDFAKARGWVEAPEGAEKGDLYAEGTFSKAPPPDTSAIDQATLNAALMEEGSVVRALGLTLFHTINAQNLVVLDAVNELRQVAGLPPYSVADFRAATSAKQGQSFYTMDEFLNVLQSHMRE